MSSNGQVRSASATSQPEVSPKANVPPRPSDPTRTRMRTVGWEWALPRPPSTSPSPPPERSTQHARSPTNPSHSALGGPPGHKLPCLTLLI